MNYEYIEHIMNNDKMKKSMHLISNNNHVDNVVI